MENATKALIMAGTVLISILLISFLIFFLRKGASASAEYYTTMSDAELAKFNAQFEVYDRDDNTYFDVITVANMVYDINKKNENDSLNQISFNLEIGYNNYAIPKDWRDLKKDTFLLNNNKEINMYTGTIRIGTEETTLISEYSKIKEETPIDYVYKFKGEITKYNDVTGKVEEIKFTKN